MTLSFDEVYQLLVRYVEEYGNCNVPQKYVTPEGICLGTIVAHIRSGNRKVSDNEREKLNSIGFVWHAMKSGLPFKEVYQLLVKYVEEHGNCNVPNKYITPEGVSLGTIVKNIRKGTRKVSDYEREKLSSIGFVWRVENRIQFDEVYRLLVRYVEEYGNCNVPQKYVTPEGVCLGTIVASIRSGKRKISKNDRKKLNSTGFVWRARNRGLPFKEVYQLLVKYVEEHGNCNVPQKYVTPEGVCLGKIVSSMRSGNRKVNDNEREKLDSIGFAWCVINKKS